MRQELKQIPLNQHSPLNYVDLGSTGCRGRLWWLLLSDQIKKRCTDCLGCALALRSVPKCECSFMDNLGDLENHITTKPVVRQYLYKNTQEINIMTDIKRNHTEVFMHYFDI